jgi:hypothetical protein
MPRCWGGLLIREQVREGHSEEQPVVRVGYGEAVALELRVALAIARGREPRTMARERQRGVVVAAVEALIVDADQPARGLDVEVVVRHAVSSAPPSLIGFAAAASVGDSVASFVRPVTGARATG